MPDALTDTQGVRVAVTGAAGLVGSNIARRVLERDANATVLAVDTERGPAALKAHLAEYQDRVEYAAVDVRDEVALARLDPDKTVTQLVHAAAIAHVPEWEREDPRRFLDVNVRGVANVLEWARARPRIRRIVHVSSGGVYGDPTPWHPDEPQPEDGPFNPPETYAISKLAGEQVARRYGELYDLDVRVIRLTAVFGPMERPTTGRLLMSLPYLLARALARDRPLRLTERTLDATGDWLSAVDVAAASRELLFQERLEHHAFNIGFGRRTPVTDLLEAARAAMPRAEIAVTGAADADVDMDPSLRRARWNAYAIERVRAATGWSPRPLADQLGEYLRWALADPVRRCP